MILCYGLARENARAAARIYAARFPRRERHPTHHQILLVVQRLREKGCLIHNSRDAGAPVRRRVRREEEILQAFYDDPGNSVRRVARDLGVSRYSVHYVLRMKGLHPYHYQRVQQQLPGDAQQRVNFCAGIVVIVFFIRVTFNALVIGSKICTGFLAQCRRDVSFPDLILWSDEATFTQNGVFNSRNFLYWDEENPHVIREGAFQYRWSINVWAGMIANQVVSVNRINFLRNFLLAAKCKYLRQQFSGRSVFSSATSKWQHLCGFFGKSAT